MSINSRRTIFINHVHIANFISHKTILLIDCIDCYTLAEYKEELNTKTNENKNII
jgi:hypothetical protein